MGKLSQILELIKLFGLKNLARLKRRHDRALPIVRGYVTVQVFWALLHTGVLDELARNGPCRLDDLAERFKLDRVILGELCEYLDCCRILKQVPTDRYALDKLGHTLLAEPRGVFDLTYGYEPILNNLTDMLTGVRKYGSGLSRREKYIAMGSGELGRQLPFPVMSGIIQRHGLRKILDLGCGDLEFLFSVCESTDAECFGIDISPDAIQHARERLAGSTFRDRVKVAQADMFQLDEIAASWHDVDCVTACDTFHEHLSEGTEKVTSLLVRLGELFPQASVLVAEFCRQSHDALKKRPTGFLEHHLFHVLTRQTILSAEEWRRVFARSGWAVAEEHVFDIVGHGYFLLRRSPA